MKELKKFVSTCWQDNKTKVSNEVEERQGIRSWSICILIMLEKVRCNHRNVQSVLESHYQYE